jgi:hypothetical protein
MFRIFSLIIAVSLLSACMSSGGNSQNTKLSSVTPSPSQAPILTAKPDLSSLDSETQTQINILCQGAYFEGTQQHWQCLDREFRTISSVSKPDLSSLDSETRAKIISLCQKEYHSGTIQYQNCLNLELGKVTNPINDDITDKVHDTLYNVIIPLINIM